MDILGVRRVREFKYLGVRITEQPGLDTHLEWVTERVARTTRFMASLKDQLLLEHRRILWCSLVLPHFTYVAALIYQLPRYAQHRWLSRMRGSFKQGLGLPRHTANWMLERMWNDPKEWLRSHFEQAQGGTTPPVKLTKSVKLLPEEWISALAMDGRKRCRDHPYTRLTEDHLMNVHNVRIPRGLSIEEASSLPRPFQAQWETVKEAVGPLTQVSSLVSGRSGWKNKKAAARLRQQEAEACTKLLSHYSELGVSYRKKRKIVPKPPVEQESIDETSTSIAPRDV
eukprot:TRINITY_DN5693_c0_g1_i1.p1 TRINITY_DN5693_c0_g1~~TRINITY_DN5693_c0_g1_i1.p1  ORF type:complete len:284 (+),score=30.52 TRINITY_DN5693_c0_g1_i1:194-1045(+)